MTWILVGTLLGSTVISYHDSEEACKSRLIVLIGKDVSGQCIPNSITPATPYGLK